MKRAVEQADYCFLMSTSFSIKRLQIIEMKWQEALVARHREQRDRNYKYSREVQ